MQENAHQDARRALEWAEREVQRCADAVGRRRARYREAVARLNTAQDRYVTEPTDANREAKAEAEAAEAKAEAHWIEAKKDLREAKQKLEDKEKALKQTQEEFKRVDAKALSHFHNIRNSFATGDARSGMDRVFNESGSESSFTSRPDAETSPDANAEMDKENRNFLPLQPHLLICQELDALEEMEKEGRFSMAGPTDDDRLHDTMSRYFASLDR